MKCVGLTPEGPTQMRWSADITSASATQYVRGVIAREHDQLRVIENVKTWAVVAQLGYGLSIIDLNAVDSNDTPYSGSRNLLREELNKTNGVIRIIGPGLRFSLCGPDSTPRSESAG